MNEEISPLILEDRLSILSRFRQKISDLRERASSAIQDVPDTLIGTIIALILLTALGLGILLLLGFLATQ